MVKKVVNDVEMKDASSPGSTTGAVNGVEKEEVKKDPDLLTLEDIKEQVKHIEKAVVTKEPRFMYRVIRALVSIRRRINHAVLRRLLMAYLGNQPAAQTLCTFLEEPMETNTNLAQFRPRTGKTANAPLLLEIEVYLHLLVVIHLIDVKKYNEGVKCVDLLMTKITSQNRRSLDMLAAKCYFYYSRVYELTDQLDKIRTFLHARLRTATLRSDFEGQAVLLNLLLRNYLHYNLIEQADKLVSKSAFPDGAASNNELARFLYYLGRIKAAQLEYTDAHKKLNQAIRKAPQHTAVGFKQTVHKLAITVELLLGNIPDRSVFRQPCYRKTLAPYFQLTQAVKKGSLEMFNEVLEKFGTKFQAENTYTLIIRLRHNVIKTGVRMINVSYSRISLKDIAQKLLLDTYEDAEYIVAKVSVVCYA
ncbi:26S proteasome non-ATPase regulatory subunit 3-like [Octopus vulgaris]|uniref:26S proteasome non-ATPase regulatory subunit 3-like n=1 Tax=Octopus vulgaris TaxID=6645 RepID=A0AA36BIE4_OCTVU|nr:26S proteasome non-ATPase regulatory subunit 3-like [Octopus vulgaris]